MTQNRKKIFSFFLLFAGIIFFSTQTYAQFNPDSLFQKNKAVIIFTKDGNQVTGLVSLKKDSSVLIKKNVKDSSEIKFSEIDRAYIADENNFFKGKYVNPNIFSPFNCTFATAFPIEKKSVFVRVTNFGFASAHMAIAKNTCVSYYTSFLGVPVGTNLRYSIKVNDHFYLAPEGGIVWASWGAPKMWLWNGGIRASQGNSQKNFTAGIGYFELNGLKLPKKLFPEQQYKAVYVNFGMQQRIGKRISLVADAWYFSKPNIVGVGVFTRHHKKANNSWSFGAMVFYFQAVKKNYFIPVPLIQWNTKF